MASSLASIAKRIEAAATKAVSLAEKNVAFALESLVQEGFDGAVDPYGAAWLPKASGTGKQLHDKGKLAASFHVTSGAGKVTVASSDPRALWHQEGTATYRGGQPYDIYPKTKKALAIPIANSRGWSNPHKIGKPVKSGRTKATGAGRRIHGGRVTASVMLMHVRHPGVPRRRMLPDRGSVPEHWRATIHRSIETAVGAAFRGISG